MKPYNEGIKAAELELCVGPKEIEEHKLDINTILYFRNKIQKLYNVTMEQLLDMKVEP